VTVSDFNLGSGKRSGWRRGRNLEKGIRMSNPGINLHPGRGVEPPEKRDKG